MIVVRTSVHVLCRCQHRYSLCKSQFNAWLENQEDSVKCFYFK